VGFVDDKDVTVGAFDVGIGLAADANDHRPVAERYVETAGSPHVNDVFVLELAALGLQEVVDLIHEVTSLVTGGTRYDDLSAWVQLTVGEQSHGYAVALTGTTASQYNGVLDLTEDGVDDLDLIGIELEAKVLFDPSHGVGLLLQDDGMLLKELLDIRKVHDTLC
jgi:hypothetical protein